MTLHESCELLDVPMPMFGFLVAGCDMCDEFAPGQMTWRMTYAGTGWGDYYGPTQAEYDPMFICYECERRERQAEAELDAYYEAEAEAEEQARLEEWVREEESQVQG